MLGQPYTIALELDLPDSPQNQVGWLVGGGSQFYLTSYTQELGMFMSCLTMSGKDGEQLFLTCRSSLLEFRC